MAKRLPKRTKKARKYRLLAGTHKDVKNVTYVPEDIVEDTMDLEDWHGKEKFIREGAFAQDVPDQRGKNRTGQFDIANEFNVEVWSKNKKWSIYELDGTPIIGGLKKSAVAETIALHFADDEDEEDEDDDEDEDGDDEADETESDDDAADEDDEVEDDVDDDDEDDEDEDADADE